MCVWRGRSEGGREGGREGVSARVGVGGRAAAAAAAGLYGENTR